MGGCMVICIHVDGSNLRGSGYMSYGLMYDDEWMDG